MIKNQERQDLLEYRQVLLVSYYGALQMFVLKIILSRDNCIDSSLIFIFVLLSSIAL